MFRRIKDNLIAIIILICLILGLRFDVFARVLITALLGLIFAFALYLAFIVVVGQRKEKRLKEMMRAVPDDMPQLIRSSLENLSEQPPVGTFILRDVQQEEAEKGHSNDASSENKVFLPNTEDEFPWEGQSLCIELADDVNDFDFSIELTENKDTILGGIRFFHAPVPRRKLKNGKLQNRYDWDWIFKSSEELRTGFEKHFAEDGRAALALFGTGESCFQSRTGTHPSWVQSQEYQKCDQCKKTMPLIAQLESSHVLPKTDFIIYVFGCPDHPEKVTPVWQST